MRRYVKLIFIVVSRIQHKIIVKFQSNYVFTLHK